MSQKIKLMEINYHTDSETGNEAIGEIDFNICVGILDNYLVEYGYKGRNAIILALSCLINDVYKRYDELQQINLKGQKCSTKSKMNL